MASTTKPARGASPPAPAPSSSNLTAIGVGIDTARYGHCVSFLRPDHQPASKKLLVMENRPSYQVLRERLEQLHQTRRLISTSVLTPPDNMPTIWNALCAACRCP